MLEYFYFISLWWRTFMGSVDESAEEQKILENINTTHILRIGTFSNPVTLNYSNSTTKENKIDSQTPKQKVTSPLRTTTQRILGDSLQSEEINLTNSHILGPVEDLQHR